MEHIKIASINDLAGICNLNSQLNIFNLENFEWSTPDYVRKAIQKGLCFITKENDNITGAMTIEDDEFHLDNKVQHSIGSLIVDKNYRDDGLGVQFVELAKMVAFQDEKKLGVHSFFDFNKKGFYENLGFKLVGSDVFENIPYYSLSFDTFPIPTFPDMKRIDIGDRLQYLEHLQRMQIVPSAMTFDSLFSFDSYTTKNNLSVLNDNIVVISEIDGKKNLFPIIGDSKIKNTIYEIIDYYRSINEHISIVLTKEQIEQMSLSDTQVEPLRDDFEYIHNSKELINFTNADRMHRQNLKRFLKNSNPKYVHMTNKQKDDVMGFYNNIIYERYGSSPPKTILEEANALNKSLMNKNSLESTGGCMYVNDRLSGFILAEKFNGTGYIHFEKAIKENGAYQALIHLFGTESLVNCVSSINREQDLGIEGLRRNKMSYGPSGFIEKFAVFLQ